jgi:7-cyano-7-deazaguanine synthase
MPTPRAPRKAVVLLSGGLDSATALAVARAEGFAAYALTLDYGQRHRAEIDAAARVARALGAKEHKVVPVGLDRLGGSALTANIDVPKGRAIAEMAQGIPVTYVPARNTVFLSIALAYAEAIGAADIFIGANVLDYSGYPDCRPEYLEAFEKMAALATKAGVEGTPVRIHAPLIRMPKREIITMGMALGVDYGLTRSCYDPDPEGRACGRCDACLLRKKGFEEAGLGDPAAYVAS